MGNKLAGRKDAPWWQAQFWPSNQYDFSDGATVAYIYYYVLVVIRPLPINIGVSFFKCILVLWGKIVVFAYTIIS